MDTVAELNFYVRGGFRKDIGLQTCGKDTAGVRDNVGLSATADPETTPEVYCAGN